MKIITNDGAEHDVIFCGLSFNDELFISTKEYTMQECFGIFSDDSVTSRITAFYQEGEKTYSGYTVLCGVSVDRDSSVQVCLRKN